MTRSDTVSLYLHIPFCRHRCAYCDFNTYTGLGALQHGYAVALAGEAAQVGEAGRQKAGAPLQAHTIFFGGGTPSLMAPAELNLILQSVRDHFELLDGAEMTMEANPGTVNAAYLDAVRRSGINRLSFGMQSAVAAELALLERSHDYETVCEAVRLSRQAGFDNLNVDLIYGLPGQSVASWQKSLEAALALEPDHLSLYCLTIEPGTPMQRWLQEGRIPAPDPDLAFAQYELACARLASGGWEHYEISNWARPGRACRHNLTYWRNEPYLGLGAGAHGYAGGYRYENVRQPRTYLRRLENGNGAPFPLSAAVSAYHQVEDEEAVADTMITQLRLLTEGLDLASFARRFGRSVRDVYGETIDQLVAWGLLRETEERLLLTERGWFLSNQVFYRFL
jgi:oxygen-independent coproporphyrinogen-3 oxidase